MDEMKWMANEFQRYGFKRSGPILSACMRSGVLYSYSYKVSIGWRICLITGDCSEEAC